MVCNGKYCYSVMCDFCNEHDQYNGSSGFLFLQVNNKLALTKPQSLTAAKKENFLNKQCNKQSDILTNCNVIVVYMVWWAKKQNEKEGGNIQIWSNSRNIQVTQEFTARFNKVKAEGKQRVLSGLTSFSRVVSWDGWYFSLSWGVFLSIFSRSVFSLRSAPLGLKKKTGRVV